MHLEGLAAAVVAGLHAVADAAHPVLHQRPIDEACPDIEDVNQLAREPFETPGLVGVYHPRMVVIAQAVVEIAHAADEARWKDTDAAVVEQVDAGRFAASA